MNSSTAERPLRIPPWIRSKIPGGENFTEIKKYLTENKLHTVCQEASCPNLGKCWQERTATAMILGDTCTRGCRFCNVKTGNPKGVIDQNEIASTVALASRLALRYIVVTSVDRDDLQDGGAAHFAKVVQALKESDDKLLVEVLIPDFKGEESSLHILGRSQPFVIAHNLETVRSQTTRVRDRRANYDLSLSVLKFFKSNYPHIATKSSLMAGLGESFEEIVVAMQDLANVGVDIVTLGQYLRPSRSHLSVAKYYTPEEFARLERAAYDLGFSFVAAGPMVRSSYRAHEYVDALAVKNGSK
ncbi:MAG: lipoyl synthase [Bdellovibrionales bacterium RIFOXYD12_FULL_39_22]|nr:MAG: lipoyl synthase [Bdellovibrionales bacterium RIFOXYB1_FULL_39_21]OFZ41010.1 MAG: lipoyl synthase [Bdellovibrionales bacterium RIFOXYC12_FULL_39_17]OFZ44838.1 MAG: lipoyl synthase [Bdellovibrionales bacterium RIFOXYC1_FULL_39_130]OFZ74303.1 MAG: lipoyl synthase [Bdellovibrionales bacterium RIFOXYD1_FULL_39_84]OFZ92167.1 MAG: lipoyl synthase [Bdellovibrionales bacterium RIFOXYD12_FULL_39_22]HLE12729.1 lipoyl synthase [Bacteriovoracaceae bacterium]